MIVQLVMLATTMHNRKNGPFRSLVAWLPKTFEARYKPDRSYLYPKHDSIVQGGWCMPAHIVIVIRSSRSTLHGLIHLLNWTRTVNIIAFNLHNMYKVPPPTPPLPQEVLSAALFSFNHVKQVSFMASLFMCESRYGLGNLWLINHGTRVYNI